MSKLQRLSAPTRKIMPMYLLGILFVVVNVVLDPSVLSSWDRVCTLASQFAPLMLCAMAQTCVLLTGGIDLSLGVTLSLMTCILATTMGEGGAAAMAGSLLLTLCAGILVGVIMGSVVTFARIPAIIVTLAFSFVWKGVALYVLPTPGGYIPYSFTKFVQGGYMIPGAAVVVLLALVVWKLIKNTRLGLAIYALGDNPRVAYENGVAVDRTRIIAYGLAGAFTAVAGMLLVGRTGSGDPTVGESFQMNSIAAAVLGGVAFTGGVGQMRGTIIGAFIITSLINILFFSGVSNFYQYIVQGAILIAVIGLKAISYYRSGGEEG